jgi:hypothetical protein
MLTALSKRFDGGDSSSSSSNNSTKNSTQGWGATRSPLFLPSASLSSSSSSTRLTAQATRAALTTWAQEQLTLHATFVATVLFGATTAKEHTSSTGGALDTQQENEEEQQQQQQHQHQKGARQKIDEGDLESRGRVDSGDGDACNNNNNNNTSASFQEANLVGQRWSMNSPVDADVRRRMLLLELPTAEASSTVAATAAVSPGTSLPTNSDLHVPSSADAFASPSRKKEGASRCLTPTDFEDDEDRDKGSNTLNGGDDDKDDLLPREGKVANFQRDQGKMSCFDWGVVSEDGTQEEDAIFGPTRARKTTTHDQEQHVINTTGGGCPTNGLPLLLFNPPPTPSQPAASSANEPSPRPTSFFPCSPPRALVLIADYLGVVRGRPLRHLREFVDIRSQGSLGGSRRSLNSSRPSFSASSPAW